MPDGTDAAKVGVVEHDGGRLAAQLQERALERRAALLHDPLADGGRSGERNQVDLRGQRELFADEVVRGGDHVEDAAREVGLLGNEATEPRGVPRRVRGGLENHRVAGGQGLPELVQGHFEREVPRHDGPHDADRLLPDLARVRRAAAVDDLTQVRPPGELVDQLDRVAQRAVEWDVELVGVGRHTRTAHLEDELLAQLLAVLLERSLQLGEAALAQLVVGGPVGLVEGAPGAVDGAVHVGARSVGHPSQDLFGGRVDVVERPAGVGFHELAVHEHPLLVTRCCRHARPPVSRWSLTEWKPNYQKVRSA